MEVICTRDLYLYFGKKAGARINTLGFLVGTVYSKMTWWTEPNGRSSGHTLRYIDLAKAIEGLTSYLEKNQYSKRYPIKQAMKSKKELLDVLKILKDK